jgi:hypothetical protein
MHIVLYRTLGSSGTFWNSPLASMTILHYVRGWVSYFSDCSRRKCMFLWPGEKPFSMLLAAKDGYNSEGCW